MVVSVIDSRPEELLVLSVLDISASAQDAPGQQTVSLKLDRLQVDNQVRYWFLLDCIAL